MRFVYADNAATTSVYPEVTEAMMPYFTEYWGNPSSLHSKGVEAKDPFDAAREKIAQLLNAKASEIYFTSCGSESDNWAIKGAARANRKKGNHIISSSIEHHAVLNSLKALEKEGFEVTYVKPDAEGIIHTEDIEAAIRPETVLITVMYANNEIGTVQPVKELAAIAHAHGILFFTDAVQAVGNIPVDIADLGVDMLSMSGHKIHAPKGIGLLYIRRGVRIENLIDGGGQEKGHRGGTENVPYAIGLAKALELAVEKLPDMERVAKMRDRLACKITEKIPYCLINGSMEKRLPGNINISFRYIEGEGMLFLLDMYGICASTGSACSSVSLEPSHVLLSIGRSHEIAHGSLRLTLSHENTDEDVDYIIETLPGIISRLRDMSPLYDTARKNGSPDKQ